MENVKDVYFKNYSNIDGGLLSLFNSTKKLIVIRNEHGVVVFDNIAHQKAFNGSLVGLIPDYIVEKIPQYANCITKDQELIKDAKVLFHKDFEEFGSETYETIREKMSFNDQTFIMTTVSQINTGIMD